MSSCKPDSVNSCIHVSGATPPHESQSSAAQSGLAARPGPNIENVLPKHLPEGPQTGDASREARDLLEKKRWLHQEHSAMSKRQKRTSQQVIVSLLDPRHNNCNRAQDLKRRCGRNGTELETMLKANCACPRVPKSTWAKQEHHGPPVACPEKYNPPSTEYGTSLAK